MKTLAASIERSGKGGKGKPAVWDSASKRQNYMTTVIFFISHPMLFQSHRAETNEEELNNQLCELFRAESLLRLIKLARVDKKCPTIGAHMVEQGLRQLGSRTDQAEIR